MISLLSVPAFGALLTGCYTLQPVRSGVVPEPGHEMAFDVTDAGRVALGGVIGPEIGQIEGRLVSKESGEYTVAVSAIHYLRGGEHVWTGERVTLKQEWVSNAYEKKFSRGRSLALAAVSVGGFAAFLVTRTLIVGDPGTTQPGDPPVSGNQLTRP